MTRTVWGTLVLMQHYAAPTRLLDWTFSPWVAAYFACAKDPKEDGYVWAVPLEQAAMACKASTPDPVRRDSYTAFARTTTVGGWQTLTKPENEQNPQEWLSFLAPTRGPARLRAQQGLFSFGFPIDRDHRQGLCQAAGSGVAIILQASLKKEFNRALLSMNLTPHSLFPDLGGIGEMLNFVTRNQIDTVAPVDDWTPSA